MDPTDKSIFTSRFHPQIFVDVDQTKFLQALNNLVSNATKFTRNNGHITVRVKEQLQSLFISVSDDGIGIPAALQPLLFDRFTKARPAGCGGEEYRRVRPVYCKTYCGDAPGKDMGRERRR